MTVDQSACVVVLEANASETDIAKVLAAAGEDLPGVHVTRGDGWVALPIGDGVRSIQVADIQTLPFVRRVVSVGTPYRLASREIFGESMPIDVRIGEEARRENRILVGGGAPLGVIVGSRWTGGSDERLRTLAPLLHEAGCRIFHAGRIALSRARGSTGLGPDGIATLRDIANEHGLALCVEVTDASQIAGAASAADLLQVGSQNMQDFSLLREMGKTRVPIILRRGSGATVEEFLLAAEYVLLHGNGSVILCESGIRTFDALRKPRFEINAVPLIKQLTHLPLVADPSKTAPHPEAVSSMVKAAVAAGADGLVLDVGMEAVHDPDGVTIDIESLGRLMSELGPIARAVDRGMPTSTGEQDETPGDTTALRVTDRTTERDQNEATYNATVDLLERNLVTGRRDRPYLRAGDRMWSFQEVSDAADAVGAGLLDLGLERGDRVILATRDRPEFVITFWGAIKVGLVAVPVAPVLSSAEMHFILVDSEARAIVCDSSSAASVVPAAEGTPATCLYVGSEPIDRTTGWSEIRHERGSVRAARTDEDDIALWLYTSGTTGLPKAVMHRHRHLRSAPEALSRQVLGMEADDVVLSVSRMFFAYGLGNSVYLPAAAGASVVLSETPILPAMIRDTLERSEATLLFGVPTFYRGLVRLAVERPLSTLRMAISAGESLDAELLERFRDRFGLNLLDGLGTTEALHHVTSNRPDDVFPGSAGRALDGYEIRVLDRDQDPVAEGRSGELWLRGPTTFAGYWRRPELTERAHDGAWMRTGDLARIVDGRLFHEGRLDDLIKLGGIQVSPVEIEDVLRGHPDVSDAVVVPIDERSGVAVLRALVVSERTESGLESELRRLCRGRLASFKIPQSFEVVSRLPTNASGKLRRSALRRDLVEGVIQR